MDTKKNNSSLTSLNYGLKGWGILILTFLCIMLDSSLINDSLNVVIDVFAGMNGWNSNMLYGFSTITAWIAVAGAAMWGVLAVLTVIALILISTVDDKLIGRN